MAARSRANLAHQLATMLDAGVPLMRALDSLQAHYHGGTGRLARRLAAALDRGQTFHEASERHFTTAERHLLAIGERSGQLPAMLRRIHETLERERRLIGMLLFQLIYPVILVHVAALVQVILAFFLGNGWPDALMAVAITLLPLYWLVFNGWLLYAFGRKWWVLRAVIDYSLGFLPLIGGALRNTALARFTRTFEALYTAGLPIDQSFHLAMKGSDNAVIEARLARALPLVQRGEDLATALARARALKPMDQQLLTTGVETGHLDEMLRHIAKIAEERAERSIKILSLLVPLLAFLIVAIFIVLLIISLFAGYLSMINDLL